MKNKASRYIYIYIIFTLLCALLISGLSACGGGKDSQSAASASQAPATASPPPTPSPTPYIEAVAPGIVDDKEPERTPPPATPSPEPNTAKVAETEPVEDSFFDDAAFLGNSLMDGFRLYSGLEGSHVYASTSMTVLGADELVAQMPTSTYNKVYILLGINEIDYDSGYFKDLYSGLLDKVEESQPGADIYICGLSPVSAYKSSTSSSFNMTNVNEYNTRLLELAGERGCHYIDLCEALAGEDGFLPADCTTDGVHFTPDKYKDWLAYLKTHHV